MRFLATLAVAAAALAAGVLAKDYTGSKVLRISVPTDADFERVNQLSEALFLDVWKEDRLRKVVDIRVDATTLPAVLALNLPYEVFIEDVQAQILAQVANRSPAVKFNNEFFEEYHTLEEYNEFVDELVRQYPNLLRSITIGTTYEGRPIRGVRLHGRNPTNKAIFFNGGQHAREWITPATVAGMLYEMVTNYGNDTVITEIIDNIDISVVVVLNPDGYTYTWTDDRLWRKNRQPNTGSACAGTDTNRNYEYKWGTGGSSSQPCSDSYKGPAPFSSAEAAAIDSHIKALQAEGLTVQFYADVHAYSQLWMSPYGAVPDLPADYPALDVLMKECASIIRSAGYNTVYQTGPIYDVIYQASGSSVDHTYAALGVKYSYALELRDTGRYGFNLPPEQIVESIEETYPAFVRAFQQVLRE